MQKQRVLGLVDVCEPQSPPIVCDMMRYRMGAEDPGPQIQYPPQCVDLPIIAARSCSLYAIDLTSYAPGTWAFCCDAIEH